MTSIRTMSVITNPAASVEIAMGISPILKDVPAGAIEELALHRGLATRDRDGRYHLGQSRPGVTGIIGELYPDPNEGT